MHKPVVPHVITIQRPGDARFLTLTVTDNGVDVISRNSNGKHAWHNSRDDAGNLISFYLNRPSYTITREVLNATNNA